MRFLGPVYRLATWLKRVVQKAKAGGGQQEERPPPEQHIEIGGGAYVEGDVNIDGGGDFVGGDKIIHVESPLPPDAEERKREIAFGHLAEQVRRFDQDLRGVIDRLDSAEARDPFKNLHPYELSDAGMYFGREQAVEDLLRRMDRNDLTVLHSESGAGKTSLLQAGLSPRLLERGHLPLYVRAYDRHPSLAIKKALLPDLENEPLLRAASLHSFLRQVTDALGNGAVLCILIDQFEEFFAALEKRPHNESFVDDMARCLDDPTLGVRWILSVRDDALGQVAKLGSQIPYPLANDYPLRPLTKNEAEAVITKLAARCGMAFEDGLVDTLLGHFGGEEVSLPQLQLVCFDLCERLPKGESVIGYRLYESAGGTEGILKDYVNRVLNHDLLHKLRQPARLLIEALVTFDSRRAMRSASSLAGELGLRRVEPEDQEKALSALVRLRLLRVEEGDPDDPVYELAHDYLLREIELSEDTKERKKAEELLARAVDDWERGLEILIQPEVLSLIESQREFLNLTDAAAQLLVRSAVACGRPTAYWVRCLSPKAHCELVKAVLEERQQRDHKSQKQAMATLWALRGGLTGVLAFSVYMWHIVTWLGRPFALGLIPVVGVAIVFVAVALSEPVETGWKAMPQVPRMAGIPIVAVNPYYADDVYVAGATSRIVWKCEETRQGLVWSESESLSPHPMPVYDLAVVEEVIYVLTSEGLLINYQDGRGWMASQPQLEMLGSHIPRAIAVNPLNPAQRYVGIEGAGIFSSTEGDETWEPLVTRPEMASGSVQALATNGRWIIAATESGIWVTRDSVSWQPVLFQECERPQGCSVSALSVPGLESTRDFLFALEQGGVIGVGNVSDGEWAELSSTASAKTCVGTAPPIAAESSTLTVSSLASVGWNLYAVVGDDVWYCRSWSSHQREWWQRKLPWIAADEHLW